jgi:hypothetical protein
MLSLRENWIGSNTEHANDVKIGDNRGCRHILVEYCDCDVGGPSQVGLIEAPC